MTREYMTTHGAAEKAWLVPLEAGRVGWTLLSQSEFGSCSIDMSRLETVEEHKRLRRHRAHVSAELLEAQQALWDDGAKHLWSRLPGVDDPGWVLINRKWRAVSSARKWTR